MSHHKQPSMVRYLLVKRGLYWAPNGQGYTGIKDYAGRYPMDEISDAPIVESLDDIKNDLTTTMIREDLAPEYSPACFWDVKEKHQRECFYAIRNEMDNGLAWSKEHGWTDGDDYDLFDGIEKETFDLPMGGSWRKVGGPTEEHDLGPGMKL